MTRLMAFETFKRHRRGSSSRLLRDQAELPRRVDAAPGDRPLRALRRDKGVMDVLLNSNGNYPADLNERSSMRALGDLVLRWMRTRRTSTFFSKIRVGGELLHRMSNVMRMPSTRTRSRARVVRAPEANTHEVQAFTEFLDEDGPSTRSSSRDVYNPAELRKKHVRSRRYKKPESFTCPQLCSA